MRNLIIVPDCLHKTIYGWTHILLFCTGDLDVTALEQADHLGLLDDEHTCQLKASSSQKVVSFFLKW